MKKQEIKRKYIFLGDVESINIEIIIKSFEFLKNKVNYILICNKNDFIKNSYYKKSNIKINEILDPLSFNNYNRSQLNIFNIENISKKNI